MSRLAATAVCAALASAALALAVRTAGQARSPQVAGDDALSVAFGDARVAIGQAMFQKADSYFHGGIDMEPHDCEMDAAHGHRHEHLDEDMQVDDDHENRQEHVADDGDGHEDEANNSFDPWRWLNSRVRAPQVERHLQGEKAVELMPWFWASVRSDPHNIDAWTTTWYVANNVMKDKDLAWRVIEEGKEKNPESLEIALYEARHVYDHGNGDMAKAKLLFEQLRDRAIERCGGDEDRLEESDRYMLKFARNYLDAIAKPVGGTPVFSATLWRGETAYVEIPAGTECAALAQASHPLDGVSLSFYRLDDVAYETEPGGKGMRSRPDVLQKLVADAGRKSKDPSICCVSAEADAAPGRRMFGPLEVTVLDRVLPPPAEWKYSLDLWQHPWAVARYFNVEPFSDRHFAKMMPVLRTLADCGCKTLTVTLLDRPWNGQCHDAYGSMVKRTKNAGGSWSFDYSTFDRYVDLGRMCGVGPDIACYTMCPWGWMASWCGANGEMHREKLLPGTPEFEDYWGDFLVDFAAHLKAKGWFGDTSIAMDERAPEDVRKVAELVARKAPGLKISMAGNRKPSDFKDIAIDNYSQSLMHMTGDFFDELATRRGKGWKTTIYVCCTEMRPNTFMESGADEGFWLCAYPYMAGFDGFLRWAANSWPEDPYKDASFNTKSWRAGDTFLVYPNGEMSSRLLDLRRGVVAAEKLRIMRESGEVTDGEIAEVVSRYGWLGAQAGKFDFGRFRAEVEALVSMPASPARGIRSPPPGVGAN